MKTGHDHNGKKGTKEKWSVLLLESDEIGRGLCHLGTFIFFLGDRRIGSIRLGLC